MKKLLFIVTLACTFSIQAQDSSAFKQQTLEFIKLTGTGDAFDNVIAQIGAQVPAEKKEAYLEAANATLDNLYSQLAEVYMKEFTSEEIAELVMFYQSDLGKKLASKQTALAQKGMTIGQKWGMELGQMAQQYSN
ncbi:DUF2059 domain-containing protein [Psychroserpens sp.]|uniref:DUF2059 domain-containing protein n=1 Tax=Psychroserpens sp. TaxID=2020870 RepID=UPI003C738AA7